MGLYSADLLEVTYTCFELSPLVDRIKDTPRRIDRIPIKYELAEQIENMEVLRLKEDGISNDSDRR